MLPGPLHLPATPVASSICVSVAAYVAPFPLFAAVTATARAPATASKAASTSRWGLQRLVPSAPRCVTDCHS